MQIMEIYEAWVKMFEHMHESWQGERIISIAQNGIAIVKSKELKCDAALFFAFSRA